MSAEAIVSLLSPAASAWAEFFPDLAVKSAAVLVAAALLMLPMRRASAAVRHLVWCVAVLSVVALPVLWLAMPRWARLPGGFDAGVFWAGRRVEVDESPQPRTRPDLGGPGAEFGLRSAEWTDSAVPTPHSALVATPAPAAPVGPPAQAASAPHARTDLAEWLFLTWVAGAAFFFAATALGAWRLRTLSRTSRPITDGPLPELVRESARGLGIGRPVRLLEGDAGVMPMTWGLFSPCLLLPAGMQHWSDERRRAVVVHELAHVRRWDFLWQLVTQAACMLYWFNPLVWFAARRMKIEREVACDDYVLDSGFKASDYAEHLLQVARAHGCAGLVRQAAIPMAWRSELEGRLLAVLDAKRNRKTLTLSTLACALAAGFLVSLPLAMLGTSAAGGQAEAQSPASSTRRTTHGQTKDRDVISGAREPVAQAKESVTVKVFDEEGTPLASVDVFELGVTHLEPHPLGLNTYGYPPVIVQGVTADDGTVRLDAAVEPEAYDRTILIARKEGLGFALREHEADEATVVLELSPEVEIRGELYRPNGMPAKGVQVKIASLLGADEHWYMYHDFDDFDTLQQEPPMPYWPASAFSDEHGRFTLRGLPSGVSVTLALSHPDLSRDWLNASTLTQSGNNDTDEARDGRSPQIVHTLEPARPVTGVVRKGDTGEPFPGAKVTTLAMRQGSGRSLSGRSDAQGRYRIVGQLGDRYRTSVYPPGESGYLGLRADKEPSPGGNGEIEMNFSLPRGRPLYGKVVDADSGEPISGARIEYVPKLGNPEHRNEFRYPTVQSDANGSFAITVIPGEGSLWVEGPSNEYMRVKQLNNRDVIRHMSEFPHAIVEVNVPPTGDTEPVEVVLREGVTLEARAVTPEGKPIPWVKALCPDLGTRGFHYEKGLFRLRGCNPAKTYRVFFLQPELHLGAVAELKYDSQADGPIMVPLQPTAKIHGKVVTPTGEPASDAQVLLFIKFENDAPTIAGQSDKVTYYGYLENMPDENTWHLEPFPRGEFHYENLVPGVALVVGVNNEPTAVAPLGVGEDRDLGTITLEGNR